MISMSRRAPKGWRWETMSCWFGGGPEVGNTGANCLSPKAVRMEAMLVSCEKSKYRVWFKGNVAVLLSRVKFA